MLSTMCFLAFGECTLNSALIKTKLNNIHLFHSIMKCKRGHNAHSLILPVIDEQLVKSLKMKPTGEESKVKNTQNVYGQFLKNVDVYVVFKKHQVAISTHGSREE